MHSSHNRQLRSIVSETRMERAVRMRPEDRKPSKRVFPLLQNLDLDSVTFAQVQGTGNPISIEDMNEQEMIDLIIVNLARLCVSGEWTGLLEAGGSGKTVPAGAAPAPDGQGYLVQVPMFYPNSKAETSSNGVVRFNNQMMNLLPFWVYEDGTMDSLTCRLASTNDDDLMVALYTSGSDGCPNTIIGTAVEWDMGTSGVITLDLSGVGDWVVEAGTQYWLGMMLKTETTNRPTFYIFNGTTGPAWTIPLTSTDTEDYILEQTGFYVINLDEGTPPATIPVEQPDGLFSDIGAVPWMTYALA